MNEKIKQFVEQNGYPKFDLKAILFDMDGVLYDSMPSHAWAWEEVMKRHNLQLSQYDVYLNEGRTGTSTIKMVCERQSAKMLSDDEIKQIYNEKNDLLKTLPPIKPMPASLELLKKIKDCGLMRMVVTGSGTATLLDGLKKNFPDIFTRELMVTADDVKHGKPNPEPYLMALQKAKLNAWNAIVVENAPLGVQAARAAGIFTIAVNTGILEDKILLSAGANLLYPSVAALCNDWGNLIKTLQ